MKLIGNLHISVQNHKLLTPVRGALGWHEAAYADQAAFWSPPLEWIRGGSWEAVLTLRQEVTYTQQCQAAVVLHLVWQKGIVSDGSKGRGWGKGVKGNLITAVAYSRIFNSKHIRPKAADVNTVCSLTFVVNICSGDKLSPSLKHRPTWHWWILF